MWVRSEDTGQGLGTQQETAKMGCPFFSVVPIILGAR